MAAEPARTARRTDLPSSAVVIPGHVRGVSGQVTVFADDPALAAGLAAFADKIKTRLLAKLAMRDTWRHPVAIAVRAGPKEAGAPITFSVRQQDRGYKYQVHCRVPPPLDQEEFVRAMVQTFCVEIANRPRAGEATLAIPPLWFTEGLTLNLLGDMRQIERDLLERLLRSQRPPTLANLFDVAALPPPGIDLEIYQVQAKVLVRALLALPDGQRLSQRFLAALEPGAAWRAAFNRVYGQAAPGGMIAESWWTNQIKSRAEPSALNRLSTAETDAALSGILAVEWVSAGARNQVSVLEMKPYIAEKGAIALVKDRLRQLQSLQLIAHQSYLPVLAQYLEAVNHVRWERFRKLKPAVAKADKLLASTRQRNSRIATALDQAEAAGIERDLMFVYRDYFKTSERLDALARNRRDIIQQYLDDFESKHVP